MFNEKFGDAVTIVCEVVTKPSPPQSNEKLALRNTIDAKKLMQEKEQHRIKDEMHN